MDFVVIIPVRLSSKRFPRKALADIHGKPMIVRVMERALDSGAYRVIVATDSADIEKVIKSEWPNYRGVCFTLSKHQSGTERIAEAVIQHYKFPENQIIVHLQGDEPLISSDIICQIANILNTIDSSIDMVTLATSFSSFKEASDVNTVKVVVNKYNNALYFSRSVIPWSYEYFENHQIGLLSNVLRHIGIYSYRAKFLHKYITWIRSPLEKLEQLEQLRVLWHGETIYVSVIHDMLNISVNTTEELERVNILFKKN